LGGRTGTGSKSFFQGAVEDMNPYRQEELHGVAVAAHLLLLGTR
jgi:hypothetical protein